MTCKNGCPINTLADMGQNGLCKRCYNIYMKNYRENNRDKINMIARDSIRAKRWLNGSDNYSGELG